MISGSAPQTPPIPSPRALARSVATALVFAVLIFVTIVLPAEYGRDPVGTGRVLGLTRMSAPLRAPEIVAPPAGSQLLVPVQQGPVAVYPAAFKLDSTQFVLGPYEFVEYKYHLQKGAAMIYSWKGTAVVMHDFHGDADGSTDSPVSYEKKDTHQESGVFTAPFAGIHGWYWENPGSDTITITLNSSGFYSSALEFRSDRSRHPHTLTDPGATSVAPTR